MCMGKMALICCRFIDVTVPRLEINLFPEEQGPGFSGFVYLNPGKPFASNRAKPCVAALVLDARGKSPRFS